MWTNGTWSTTDPEPEYLFSAVRRANPDGFQGHMQEKHASETVFSMSGQGLLPCVHV